MTEEKQQEEIKKVSKHDFYFEIPLYEVLKLDKIEKGFLEGDVDAWSAINSTETTYKILFQWVDKIERKDIGVYGTEWVYKGFAEITLTCKRKDNDILRFFVYKDEINGFIIKVGQFPSIADLQFADIERKYSKVLRRQYLNEFKKSIVSASHGYGVAAFVYLRRIFENLILNTFKKHKSDLNLDPEEFIQKRMEEKVDLLKEYLPEQLVKMKAVYGILSKGIHELDEQECSEYYAPLKLSIELILDQKIEQEEKRKRDEEVKKQIAELTKKLKK